MVLGIWEWTTHGLLFHVDLLHEPSHGQAYHGLCYTSCGALAAMEDGKIGPRCVIDPMIYCTMRGHSTTELCLAVFTVIHAHTINMKIAKGLSRTEQCLVVHSQPMHGCPEI